jgi:hypothetical protein
MNDEDTPAPADPARDPDAAGGDLDEAARERARGERHLPEVCRRVIIERTGLAATGPFYLLVQGRGGL